MFKGANPLTPPAQLPLGWKMGKPPSKRVHSPKSVHIHPLASCGDAVCESCGTAQLMLFPRSLLAECGSCINSLHIRTSRQIVPTSYWGPRFCGLVICTWAVTTAEFTCMPWGIWDWDYQFCFWVEAEAMRRGHCNSWQVPSLEGAPVSLPHKILGGF
jgi:hypothetical protein